MIETYRETGYMLQRLLTHVAACQRSTQSIRTLCRIHLYNADELTGGWARVFKLTAMIQRRTDTVPITWIQNTCSHCNCISSHCRPQITASQWQ